MAAIYVATHGDNKPAISNWQYLVRNGVVDLLCAFALQEQHQMLPSSKLNKDAMASVSIFNLTRFTQSRQMPRFDVTASAPVLLSFHDTRRGNRSLQRPPFGDRSSLHSVSQKTLEATNETCELSLLSTFSLDFALSVWIRQIWDHPCNSVKEDRKFSRERAAVPHVLAPIINADPTFFRCVHHPDRAYLSHFDSMH